MDLGHLEEMVSSLVDASIAPTTKRVYMSGQRKYLAFCESIQCQPLPMTEDRACLFVAYLTDLGLKHSSIKGYLSAVRRLQVVAGLGNPFSASWPLLECTLKGVKRQEARSSVTRPQSRLPITPGILRHLRGIWGRNPHDYDAIMLWAACCMCFFGFLRSGEVTVSSMREYDQEAHLSEGDVMVDSVSKPTVVQVRIKESKTDPFRKGVMVYLGFTEDELCPVAAVTAYLAVRGRDPGPFFRLKGGAPLSREVLVRKVREALQSSGVQVGRYSGHSFRIGAATTAAAVGIEDSVIKTLGRWRSAAYMTYVRMPREKLTSISQLLTKNNGI